MLPGKMISCPILPCCGGFAITVGAARASVWFFSLVRARTRGTIPPTATSDGQHQKNHDHDRGDAAGRGGASGGPPVPLIRRLRLLVSIFLIHLYALSPMLFLVFQIRRARGSEALLAALPKPSMDHAKECRHEE